MIPAAILFSWVAACVVWLTGRRDPARDARLTAAALLCLLLFPLSAWLPKLAVVPIGVGAGEGVACHLWAITALWGAGTLVFLLRLLVACIRLRHWRRESRLLSSICSPETGGRRIELRVLDSLPSPVAAGVIRPVIYLPVGWESMPEAVRRAVLLHETGHHRRRDPLWRMIAAAACAVHWFNPLVWWMARRFAAQCEYACDAAVLVGGFRAGDYAHMLCDLASAVPMPAPALAMATATGLEARVRRLAIAPEPLGTRGFGMMAAAFLLLAGASLAMLGPATVTAPRKTSVTADEVTLRWTANPFPGE